MYSEYSVKRTKARAAFRESAALTLIILDRLSFRYALHVKYFCEESARQQIEVVNLNLNFMHFE